jgi:hypothetical protein
MFGTFRLEPDLSLPGRALPPAQDCEPAETGLNSWHPEKHSFGPDFPLLPGVGNPPILKFAKADENNWKSRHPSQGRHGNRSISMIQDRSTSLLRVQIWGPIRIAGIYLALGVLWILFSDQLAAQIAADEDVFARISTYKGWGFVIVTALLLFLLIRRHTATVMENERQLSLDHGCTAGPDLVRRFGQALSFQ